MTKHLNQQEIKEIFEGAKAMGYEFLFNKITKATHIAHIGGNGNMGCGLNRKRHKGELVPARKPFVSCNGCSSFARRRNIPFRDRSRKKEPHHDVAMDFDPDGVIADDENDGTYWALHNEYYGW